MLVFIITFCKPHSVVRQRNTSTSDCSVCGAPAHETVNGSDYCSRCSPAAQ